MYSKSVRVIDAKLSVYNKYQHELESKNILLHHDYEEEDEIIKRSRIQKLASSIKDVLLIGQHIPTEKMESTFKIQSKMNCRMKESEIYVTKSVKIPGLKQKMLSSCFGGNNL